MKSRAIGFLALVFFFLPVSLSFAGDLFFIADDMDAAPYISADARGLPMGILYDTVKTAFKRMNKPFRYEVHPWKRAQMIVEKGQADALITTPTPKRLQFLVPSQEVLFTMKTKIFTQEDNPNIARIRSIHSLTDLEGLRIIDYIGDGWAEKNLAQFGILWAPSLSTVCKMIAAYRGDVFIQDENLVKDAIKNIKARGANRELRFDRIVAFDVPIQPIDFHLLIRKDSGFLELMPEFDKTIRAMRREGVLDRIKARWVE
ncbi:substrate-binding periplasmic protein [Desulfospira joergensenii]|uniref:substrate-binding periplasmic protein n=1 Tax=Desulfospira joergensenii TaxID=53329 RepID=UPI0003B44040|nr:transporter substrate-binding domain-containing protein [Desulfospira joergensenii]